MDVLFLGFCFISGLCGLWLSMGESPPELGGWILRTGGKVENKVREGTE